MDARYQDIAVRLRDIPPGQACRTLDLVARMLRKTDHDLHEATGRAMSQATINHKRSGRSPIKPADLWPLSEALGVDPDVLLLPTS